MSYEQAREVYERARVGEKLTAAGQEAVTA